MTLQVFNKDKNDEANFLQLLKQNPTGFVLNYDSPGYEPFIKIHKATCPYMLSEKVGPYTGHGYTKVYADSIGEIEQWKKVNGIADGSRCKCKICSS
ncbi:hypothetical protein CJD50_20980 [Hafnia paralvei]|uniref:Uncharacterized protein n=1 Tax=Hafnia paralvei TaxID=546367 RepID=A0A2A2M8Q1_9GAMM|nr:hypothetical protein [Hafnia paralvei]PAV94526.1 hypothetical protein CJD50_20980 [Hafnia paralvei]TBL52724.1 hypothetical protein EYZ00_11700 [Hafnia paralvei]